MYGNSARPASFSLGGGTAAPLLFASRQIELLGGTGASAYINNHNATPANTITINTDLIVTSTGAKTLTLGGSNTGANTFGGVIADGVGSVISLTKTGAGTWILSGANTYTGNTTVSAGTLVLGSTGQLKFAVTDTTTNTAHSHVAPGAVTLNGSFNIDTSAVPLAQPLGPGPWSMAPPSPTVAPSAWPASPSRQQRPLEAGEWDRDLVLQSSHRQAVPQRPGAKSWLSASRVLPASLTIARRPSP